LVTILLRIWPDVFRGARGTDEPGHQDDVERIAQINDKYGLAMAFESVPVLCERFGLTFQGG